MHSVGICTTEGMKARCSGPCWRRPRIGETGATLIGNHLPSALCRSEKQLAATEITRWLLLSVRFNRAEATIGEDPATAATKRWSRLGQPDGDLDKSFISAGSLQLQPRWHEADGRPVMQNFPSDWISQQGASRTHATVQALRLI
jgi:hypothetical protein